MENISTLRRFLEKARVDASVAEVALQRAELRSSDATRELERCEKAYSEALRIFVWTRKPEVLPLWTRARAALESSNLRATYLKQALASDFESKGVSDEPTAELVDQQLRVFLAFARSAVVAVANLRMATASTLRPMHEELKGYLAVVQKEGASTLISRDRSVADAAKYWFESCLNLLKLLQGQICAELECVAAVLEEAEQKRINERKS